MRFGISSINLLSVADCFRSKAILQAAEESAKKTINKNINRIEK